MQEKRFAGAAGTEFEVFARALPHRKEQQDCLGSILREHAKARPQESEFLVVEAGAGTGMTTERIVESDSRMRVRAIDNEAKTLDQARLKFKADADRVIFQEADIIAYLKSIEAESVDVFVSGFTIHNFLPELRQILFQEIGRTTKPGGLYLNLDKIASDNEVEHLHALKLQIQEFDVLEEMGRHDLKDEWVRHYHADDLFRFTEAEQQRLLLDGGFPIVQIHYRKLLIAVCSAIKSVS